MAKSSVATASGPRVVSTGSLSRFFFALALALGAIFSKSFAVLISIFVLGILAIQIWKGSLKGAVKFGRLVLPLAVFIFLLHLFTHPGEPLFRLSFLSATAAGARAGLLYGLKLFIYAVSGYIIFAAVDPFALIEPLERLARVTGPLGRYISAFAIAFFLALRFLPELSVQGKSTLLALRARGFEPRGGPVHKMRLMLYIAAPLFVNGFKRADLAAMALDIKGYGTRYMKAIFAPIRLDVASLLTILAGAGILIAGIKF